MSNFVKRKENIIPLGDALGHSRQVHYVAEISDIGQRSLLTERTRVFT